MNREEFNENLELYHHGIKGQKWGIRRFQNLDGTLTEAGKKLKKINSDAEKKREKKLEENKKLQKDVDNIKNMSDQDLQHYINRLSNEKRLRDMLEDEMYPGKREVKNFLKDKGKIIAGTLILSAGTGIGLYAMNNASSAMGSNLRFSR